MKCRFLRGENDHVCAAGATPYVPSVFEEEEDCLTERHVLCSFYCLGIADDLIGLSGEEPQSQPEVQ